MTYNTAGMGTYGATWQHRGYAGSDEIAPLVGALTGRVVIICGNAEGVFRECEVAMERFDDAVVFGVNDVGMFLPRLDHWVSLHAEHLLAWRNVRWLHGLVSNVEYHSISGEEPVKWVWNSLMPTIMALSGYFAAQVAYVMGAERIILCGCPGSAVRRFFEGMPQTFHHYGGGDTVQDHNFQNQFISEMNRLPDFKSRLRSMSGWTRGYLGGL